VWFAAGKLLNASRRDTIDGTYDAICRGACAWRVGHGRPDGPEFRASGNLVCAGTPPNIRIVSSMTIANIFSEDARRKPDFPLARKLGTVRTAVADSPGARAAADRVIGSIDRIAPGALRSLPAANHTPGGRAASIRRFSQSGAGSTSLLTMASHSVAHSLIPRLTARLKPVFDPIRCARAQPLSRLGSAVLGAVVDDQNCRDGVRLRRNDVSSRSSKARPFQTGTMIETSAGMTCIGRERRCYDGECHAMDRVAFHPVTCRSR